MPIVQVRTPGGEIVDVDVEEGLSDDEIRSRLRERAPELFEEAPTPQPARARPTPSPGAAPAEPSPLELPFGQRVGRELRAGLQTAGTGLDDPLTAMAFPAADALLRVAGLAQAVESPAIAAGAEVGKAIQRGTQDLPGFAAQIDIPLLGKASASDILAALGQATTEVAASPLILIGKAGKAIRAADEASRAARGARTPTTFEVAEEASRVRRGLRAAEEPPKVGQTEASAAAESRAATLDEGLTTELPPEVEAASHPWELLQHRNNTLQPISETRLPNPSSGDDFERWLAGGALNPDGTAASQAALNTMDPSAAASAQVLAEAAVDKTSWLSLQTRKLWQDASKILKRFGPGGDDVSRRVEDFMDAADRDEGAVKVDVAKAFENTSPEFRATWQKQVDSGVFTREGQAVLAKIQPVWMRVGRRAEADKVEVTELISRPGFQGFVGGRQTRAFQAKQLFYPRSIDYDKVGNPAKNQKLRNMIAADLQAEAAVKGIKLTDAQVATGINARLRLAQQRNGHLQFSRVTPDFDPDLFITDPVRAYQTALGREVRWLNALERFGHRSQEGLLRMGPTDQTIIGLDPQLNAIEAAMEAASGTGAAARRMTHNLVRRAIGQVNLEALGADAQKWGRVAAHARNFNVRFLSFLTVMNAAQSFLGPAFASVPNAARGFYRAAFKGAQATELAQRLGVATANTTEVMSRLGMDPDLAGNLSGRFARRFLEITGGAPSERFLERFFSETGLLEAQDLITKFRADPTSKRLKKGLEWLSLDPANVLAADGTQLADLAQRGARSFARQLLLRGDVATLPPAFTSEIGKNMLQFRRAAQQMSRLLFARAVRDPRTFAKFLIAGTAGSGLVLTARTARRGLFEATFKGDMDFITQELERLKKQGKLGIAMEMIATGMMTGILGEELEDLFLREGDGEQKLANLLFGPSLSGTVAPAVSAILEPTVALAQGRPIRKAQIGSDILRGAGLASFFTSQQRRLRQEERRRERNLRRRGLIRQTRRF